MQYGAGLTLYRHEKCNLFIPLMCGEVQSALAGKTGLDKNEPLSPNQAFEKISARIFFKKRTLHTNNV